MWTRRIAGVALLLCACGDSGGTSGQAEDSNVSQDAGDSGVDTRVPVDTQATSDAADIIAPTDIEADAPDTNDPPDTLETADTQTATETSDTSVAETSPTEIVGDDADVVVTTPAPTIDLGAPPEEPLSGMVLLPVDIDAAEGVESVAVTLGGVDLGRFHMTPSEIGFDTRLVSNGAHTFVVTVRDVVGRSASSQVQVTVDNPGFRLVSYQFEDEVVTPQSYVLAYLHYDRADLTLSADMTRIIPGVDPDEAYFRNNGDGDYQLQFYIPDPRDLPAGVTLPNGHVTFDITATADGKSVRDTLSVSVFDGPLLPFSSAGGRFVPGPKFTAPPPSAPALDAPTVTILSGLQGGTVLMPEKPAKVKVTWTPGTDVEVVQLDITDFAGAYQYTAPVGASSLEVDLEISAREGSSFMVGMRQLEARLIDSTGAISEPGFQEVLVSSKGYCSCDEFYAEITYTGKMQTYLVLFEEVMRTRPYTGGTFVYVPPGYNIATQNEGVPYSGAAWSGGVPDFDTCGGGTHRLTFPKEFPAWSYNFYPMTRPCEFDDHTDFKMTINYCGKVQEWEETNVTYPKYYSTNSTFLGVYATCPAIVGAVRYDKFEPLTGRHKKAPARDVTVQLLDAATDTVVATASTNHLGRYRLRAPVNTVTSYYVRVLAAHEVKDESTFVLDTSGTLYTFDSTIEEYPTAYESTLDLEIDAAHGAAAFGMLDTLVDGRRSYQKYLAKTKKSLVQPLTVVWEDGKDTSLGQQTYFDQAVQSIYVQGGKGTNDPWDASVLMHELAHFLVRNLSKDTSPGGAHSGARADPTLAWSEGIATFYGQRAIGHPVYVDSGAGGFGQYSIETLSRFPRATIYGTDTKQMNGKVSELLVSAILWDIYDDTQEDFDDITGPEDAMDSSVFYWLGIGGVRNGGYTGIDLVDFLDGWLKDANDNTLPGALCTLLLEHELPYDYNGLLASCP